jgi:hypothetical protein
VRRAAKRDKAEPAIVAALLAVGAQVERLSLPVDLLVRFRGKLYLAEVKTEGQSSHAKERTKQAEFCSTWNIPYWRTPEDALSAIGANTDIRIQTGNPYRGLPSDFDVIARYSE